MNVFLLLKRDSPREITWVRLGDKRCYPLTLCPWMMVPLQTFENIDETLCVNRRQEKLACRLVEVSVIAGATPRC